MKKLFSLLLAITILISAFSIIGVNAETVDTTPSITVSDKELSKLSPQLKERLEQLADDDTIKVAIWIIVDVNQDEIDKEIQERLKAEGLLGAPETLENIQAINSIKREITQKHYTANNDRVLSEIFDKYTDGYELTYVSAMLPNAEAVVKKSMVYDIISNEGVGSVDYVNIDDNQIATQPTVPVVTTPTDPTILLDPTLKEPAVKKANTVTVKSNTITVKAKNLKTKKVTKEALKITKAKGKVDVTISRITLKGKKVS
ncbi:MAG: hypothetical protein ACI4Q8_07595, partial [Ruminococcus sp.]